MTKVLLHMEGDGYLASGLNAILDSQRYWKTWEKLEVLPVLAPRGIFLPQLRPFMLNWDVLVAGGAAEGDVDFEHTWKKIEWAKAQDVADEDSPWADMQ
jgi:hypothetical protein